MWSKASAFGHSGSYFGALFEMWTPFFQSLTNGREHIKTRLACKPCALKPHADSGPAVLQELESHTSLAVVEDSDVFGHGQGGHDNGFVGLLVPVQARAFHPCVIGGQVH